MYWKAVKKKKIKHECAEHIWDVFDICCLKCAIDFDLKEWISSEQYAANTTEVKMIKMIKRQTGATEYYDWYFRLLLVSTHQILQTL